MPQRYTWVPYHCVPAYHQLLHDPEPLICSTAQPGSLYAHMHSRGKFLFFTLPPSALTSLFFLFSPQEAHWDPKPEDGQRDTINQVLPLVNQIPAQRAVHPCSMLTITNVRVDKRKAEGSPHGVQHMSLVSHPEHTYRRLRLLGAKLEFGTETGFLRCSSLMGFGHLVHLPEAALALQPTQ